MPKKKTIIIINDRVVIVALYCFNKFPFLIKFIQIKLYLERENKIKNFSLDCLINWYVGMNEMAQTKAFT